MTAPTGRRTRILLLDDSATARAALSSALTRRGYEVIAAGNLAALEAALDRKTPDLVLLDVHLPEIIGTDLVPWLRETRRYAGPILLCSTRPPDELARLTEECGADGWVRKNGRPDELAARVEYQLAGGEL